MPLTQPEQPIIAAGAPEVEILKDQIGRLIRARQDDAAQISDLCAQLDTARADLARETATRITATTERDAMARQIADLGNSWVEINTPFHLLCERVIDSGRLVGFEVEVDGERYLVGDVNPGGHREGGQAFRRDAIVTRARVRVRK